MMQTSRHLRPMLALVPILFSSFALAQNCLQTRAAIDIGSGSTKIAVAEVDTCQQRIHKMLFQQQLPVAYNDALMHSADQRLPESVIKQGLAAITQEVNAARRFHPVSIRGVGTAVFRSAENGPQVMTLFAQHSGASLRIISQRQEALLGFASAKATLNDPSLKDDDILVWDIGGGSMQMTTFYQKDGKMTPVIYQGKLASVTLKNYIISLLQNKPLQADSSPNPIGTQAENVLKFVRFYADNDVDPTIKSLITQRKVIGIGGVHDYSLRDQFVNKPNSYTLSGLTALAAEQVNKSDDQLSGDYRATDISNLLLVEGYMQALNIPQVTLAKASLVQGLLTE